MYAKLKNDGQIQMAENPIRITISNPTPEQYAFAGYKEVIETEPPEYDVETQYLESHYEEVDNKLVQVWNVKEIPREENLEDTSIE